MPLSGFSRFGLHYFYVTIGNIPFLPKLLPVQSVVFYLTFEEELPIRQGIRFPFDVQRPFRRWLPCMRSQWRSCNRSRHSSCYPSQVTLCPRSPSQPSSPEFQTHNTKQFSYRAPCVQTSRGTSQYLPLSVIGIRLGTYVRFH